MSAVVVCRGQVSVGRCPGGRYPKSLLFDQHVLLHDALALNYNASPTSVLHTTPIKPSHDHRSMSIVLFLAAPPRN